MSSFTVSPRLIQSRSKQMESTMRAVLSAIFDAKRSYEQLPLFQFMRDEALTARERIGFYPCMAPFILAFGDLNKYVMRDEQSNDAYQKLVNLHSREDDHHRPWFLEDFSTLGFDVTQLPTDVLRFLYSDETKVNRMLSMKLAHLLYGATAIERLVIIESIEETGNVLFGLTVKLARRIERDEGVTLRYLGDFHFSLESGHAMCGDDHRELAAIDLDATQRTRCLALVNEVFRYFQDWTNELLAFAVHEIAQPTAPPRRVMEIVTD
jgi:hypothetical protein